MALPVILLLRLCGKLYRTRLRFTLGSITLQLCRSNKGLSLWHLGNLSRVVEELHTR